MANLFISCLGTTNYEWCNYELEVPNSDDKQSAVSVKKEVETRFTQVAIADAFCRAWTNDDRILVFTTETADKKNWEGDAGLRAELEGLGLAVSIEKHIIPDGFSKKEFLKIFTTIIDQIGEQDVITLDITHGFRSLPFMVRTVLDYAAVLKEARVGRVLYGCYEASSDDVDGCKGAKPILDLGCFVSIDEWSLAVQEFLKTGSAEGVEKAANSQYFRPIGIAGRRDSDNRQLIGSFRNFAQDIVTCRSQSIAKHAIDLRTNLSEVKLNDELAPVKPLLNYIAQKLNMFGNDPTEAIEASYAAAQWSADLQLVYQAYIFFMEACVSELITVGGMESKILDRDTRAAAERSLVGRVRDNEGLAETQHRDGEPEAECFKSLIKAGKHSVPKETLSSLKNLRNDLAHGGWRGETSGDQPATPVDIKTRISDAIKARRQPK